MEIREYPDNLVINFIDVCVDIFLIVLLFLFVLLETKKTFKGFKRLEGYPELKSSVRDCQIGLYTFGGKPLVTQWHSSISNTFI